MARPTVAAAATTAVRNFILDERTECQYQRVFAGVRELRDSEKTDGAKTIQTGTGGTTVTAIGELR